MESERPQRAEVDSSTIQRASQGDKSALGRIYDAYAALIYRYIYSRVGNAPDAEDITAQTFLAVIESLPRYQPRENFSAWIFQIARNKSADHFRKFRIQEEISESLADLNQSAALDVVIENESHTRLKSLLHLLSEDERELIRLRYTVELSFVEIANVLGRKEDAVRKSIKRILDRLSTQMEAQNA